MGLCFPLGACHAQTVQIDEKKVSLTIGFGPTIFMGVDEKDAKAVVYSSTDSIIADLTTERLDMVSTSLIEYRVITQQTDTEIAYTKERDWGWRW